MATTKTKIILNALSILGKGRYASLADAGAFGSEAQEMYDLKIESVLSKGSWRFATAIKELSRLVTAPIIDDWSYIYQLPADYLSLVKIYPQTLGFNIYENKHLYTNLSKVTIEYRYKPDESRFPKYFEEYITYYLAEVLAFTGGIASNAMEKLAQRATQLRIEALGADSYSHPNTAIQNQPYINVRG